jgi:hypothetical protein
MIANRLAVAAAPLRSCSTALGERVHDAPERARQHLDGAIAVAAAEVERLQRAVQDLAAAGQLAGLVQDRTTSGSYRQRLGLMTQIRRDFEAMAEPLLAASTSPTTMISEAADLGRRRGPEPSQRTTWWHRRSRRHRLLHPSEQDVDVAGDRLPAIDRIVLYIREFATLGRLGLWVAASSRPTRCRWCCAGSPTTSRSPPSSRLRGLLFGTPVGANGVLAVA